MSILIPAEYDADGLMRRHPGVKLAQHFGLNDPDLLRAQDATLPAKIVMAPASMAAATATRSHISGIPALL